MQHPLHSERGDGAAVGFDFIGFKATGFTDKGQDGHVLKMWDAGGGGTLGTTGGIAGRADKGNLFGVQAVDGGVVVDGQPPGTGLRFGFDEGQGLEGWLRSEAVDGEVGSGA